MNDLVLGFMRDAILQHNWVPIEQEPAEENERLQGFKDAGFNPSGASPVWVRELCLVAAVPADALTTMAARPSAYTKC